jgi:8-oxo-dGTP pyrophosphatase MutT (NUDIX family)
MLTKIEIRERLERAYLPNVHPESPYPEGILDSNPQPAAVLIPFLKKEDGWHLLYIRRTVMPHDRHSGQVAYPGGRCDQTDPDAKAAALREACEEIGVCREDVEVLGRVRDMLTITNFRVTPIVGEIPWPYDFTPQEDEVDRIFTIPLNWLADPKNYEVRMRGLQLLGRDVPVIYFSKFDGELLWGASARITILLLEALGLASPNNRYSLRKKRPE